MASRDNPTSTQDSASADSLPTTGESFVARANLAPMVAGIGGWADPDLGRLSDLNIDIEKEVHKGDETK
ncbi:hypothetical protein HYQ45_000793 [Verticillium longisporum]|uniref:Uncharacterized protein n=1 Tax=Verticillium longisporum TaxID=100787 RepID=A0A8I3AXC5_VERLO|nr:hypothetical protein HYQ45_000793 [Verticillium longisporum]